MLTRSQPVASAAGFEALFVVQLAIARLRIPERSVRPRTRRCVGLQGGDNPGLGDFIRPAVLHIDGGQQEHVTLLSDARGNGLHDFPIDRLLVVCDEVLVQEFLNLVRGEPGKHTLAIHRLHGELDKVSLTSSRCLE